METRTLLIFVSDELTETTVRTFLSAGRAMLDARHWVAAPVLIDHTDLSGRTIPEDEPVRTVGVSLQVPSPVTMVPRDWLLDIQALVDWVRSYTVASGHRFQIELDGVFVGEVFDGRVDDLFFVAAFPELRPSGDAFTP